MLVICTEVPTSYQESVQFQELESISDVAGNGNRSRGHGASKVGTVRADILQRRMTFSILINMDLVPIDPDLHIADRFGGGEE